MGKIPLNGFWAEVFAPFKYVIFSLNNRIK